ncbi:hypothetical protein GE061_009871 [Apolygus lucorum]|uniref:Elongation factor Ts, mitochondrial n=1 Tax=Apolygus lucorum TaxID=248454 RepID=A0A8S9Y1H3_APOLU|nr:hypothetical protein GE061_009871 [Apolygus lucorum]
MCERLGRKSVKICENQEAERCCGSCLGLRKKTGYTFANCKKALEMSNNDLAKAEQWLKEQAQALGWSKATKLEGRATAQGLVGLALKNNTGVMVEVNCETDFVARNKTFTSLVEMVAASCFKQVHALKDPHTIGQLTLDSSELKSLPGPDKAPLGDHMALAISSVGENLSLRRALIVTVPKDIFITGYTHPSPDKISAKVMTGKYSALVAYTTRSEGPNTHQVARQLCQHVVGMNPSKVGVAGADEPAENVDDETVMIHQDFLLDPSTTVGQLMEASSLDVLQFWRFECGEDLKPQELSPAEPSLASQAG